MQEYVPEAANNFFQELEEALVYRPDYGRVYRAYNQVFQRFVNQHTSQTHVNLAGTFAKTDYLLKEHQAKHRMVKNTNDTRVRLRHYQRLTNDELQACCLTDLKHLCHFVEMVCDVAIPASLANLFPPEEVHASTPLLTGECMRVIVYRWDETYAYVQTEDTTDGELTRVCYSGTKKPEGADWSYLKDMLYEGAQLNLVRPRQADGIVYPELIILEPDLLINISTVAHCFTNYADSPFVDLIKKLEPATQSKATLLGGAAGQLLDESIHKQTHEHGFEDSWTDFRQTHALDLLTTDIGPETDLKEEARRQEVNIARAIHEGLPKMLSRFDPKDGLVEPSFFSEMLGLQGRMDYLQMDMKVLLEQKSGKGRFPYDNFSVPRQTEEHYVQLLLYMMLIRYNFRDTYERNGRELHAFLLYSKYSESLLGLGFSPELMFKAIKVRNGLAWAEMRYAQPDGFRMLERLTPEHFNKKHVKNSLWTLYQRPQIAQTLAPIHQASELERAYYFRFMTFVANEHLMAKLGNKTKESSGFAATWHDTLADKLAAGNIYDRLSLCTPEPDEKGRIASVVLKFSETDDNDMSNFRPGDIVILYPYAEGEEPDARRTMVFRCTIQDIRTDKICLVLRAPQTDDRVFLKERGKLWAIEHDFMESSFSSLYKGMHAFLSAPRQRRDLLLLQRQPEVDETRQLRGDYGAFNELALHVKQARDFFLIIGPPGTGKTSFGMLYTVKEELLEPNSNILLLSYTNRAVDEICSKLKQEGIDYVRVGSPLSCAEDYKDHLLSALVQKAEETRELRERLLSTRVFVGTTTAFNSHLALFQLKQFSLAVIDEASQILEPHLMGLLSANVEGEPAIRKFVLIGDHKQLPAVVQQRPETSQINDPQLLDIHLTDCRLSLFERLQKRYGQNPQVTYMLRKQGRMHPAIAQFPNFAFYDQQLQPVPVAHQTVCLPQQGNGNNGIDDLITTRRIAFVHADAPLQSPTDKVNQNEADIIAALVLHIYQKEKENFDVNSTVGVIVPYRNQIAAIRKTIDRHGVPQLHDIAIDTVERFQGSQRRYIIYGFTIQKYYQLSFLTDNVFEDTDGSIIDRKLNVAMTRAEEHLIVVGNAELLANNFTFQKLMDFTRSQQSFFRVNLTDFLQGRFSVPILV